VEGCERILTCQSFCGNPPAPALALRRSPRALRTPARVAGREIVLQDCLVLDRYPRGSAISRRGSSAPVALAPGHSDAGDLFAAYNRSRAPADLPDFLGALAVLVAWGALERQRE
jgi:hypothetical protein